MFLTSLSLWPEKLLVVFLLALKNIVAGGAVQ